MIQKQPFITLVDQILATKKQPPSPHFIKNINLDRHIVLSYERRKKTRAHYLRAEGRRLQLWREKDRIKSILKRR